MDILKLMLNNTLRKYGGKMCQENALDIQKTVYYFISDQLINRGCLINHAPALLEVDGQKAHGVGSGGIYSHFHWWCQSKKQWSVQI